MIARAINWIVAQDRADDRRDVGIIVLFIIVGLLCYGIIQIKANVKTILQNNNYANQQRAVADSISHRQIFVADSISNAQCLAEEQKRTRIAEDLRSGYMILVDEHLRRNVKDSIELRMEKQRLEREAKWTSPK